VLVKLECDGWLGDTFVAAADNGVVVGKCEACWTAPQTLVARRWRRQ
jgi:hypothetical protein